MRVRAIQLGYYGLVRRNEGEVFEMAESAMKKDPSGKLSLPKWVEKAAGAPESIPKGTIKQGVGDKPTPAGAPAVPEVPAAAETGEELGVI